MIARAVVLLCLLATTGGRARAEDRIELVLDCSLAMEEELAVGQSRMDAARGAIETWIFEQGVTVTEALGLTVIGGESDDPGTEPCAQIRRLVGPGPADSETWPRTLASLRPSGSRPLLRSVVEAATSMDPESGAAALILVTSGEDDCDGDVEAAAAALEAGVELHVVGLGLTEDAAQRFETVAPTLNATDSGSVLHGLRAATDAIYTNRVSLRAPLEVTTGKPFEVEWLGPGGEADFLSVAGLETDAESYLEIHLVEEGNPAEFTAPSPSGEYELRYVSGRTGRVLARVALEITDAAVEIVAPPRVTAGDRFEVSWTGPNAAQDFIAIAPAGSPWRRHLDWIYTSLGSPTTMAAPGRVGDYEIRYIRGEDREVLAAVPLIVDRR